MFYFFVKNKTHLSSNVTDIVDFKNQISKLENDCFQIDSSKIADNIKTENYTFISAFLLNC